MSARSKNARLGTRSPSRALTGCLAHFRSPELGCRAYDFHVGDASRSVEAEGEQLFRRDREAVGSRCEGEPSARKHVGDREVDSGDRLGVDAAVGPVGVQVGLEVNSSGRGIDERVREHVLGVGVRVRVGLGCGHVSCFLFFSWL